MRPGNTSAVSAEPASAWITSTVGMDCSLVQTASEFLSLIYASMRTETMRAAMPRAAIPAYFRRRKVVSRCSRGLSDMGLSCVFGDIARVHDGENRGYEK